MLGKHDRKIVLATIAAIGMASSCNSTTPATVTTTTGGTTTTASTPATTTSTPAVVPNLTISGLVGAGKASALVSGLVTASDVTNGTWILRYVGGGGADIANGTVVNGSFSVPTIPQGQEGVIIFGGSDGSSQRCLVKAGDSGILCNLVADSVLTAFEAVLGFSVTDPQLAGKSVSKIASSIVDAAQNSSTATDGFLVQVDACKAGLLAAQPTCFKNAILASPFAGAFTTMKTMVGGWNVEALFNLVADTGGFTIGIDSFTYSQFATNMDTWLGTDFIARTRAFIGAVVADQIAGGNSYVVKVECAAYYSKTHSGGSFKYSPIMVTGTNGILQPSCTNDAVFALNGLTGPQITTLDAAIAAGAHGGIQLGSASCNGGNWDTPGLFCMYKPELKITSKFIEDNRNDKLGKNRTENDNRSISLINAFPEFMTALGAASADATHGSCLTANADGPPNVNASASCQTWFGGVIAAQKNNLAGMMGLYMYLKNPTSAGKVSLADLHSMFTKGGSFLQTRIAAWAPQFSGKQGTNGYVSPYLTFANGIWTEQSEFQWSTNATQLQVDAAVARANLPYDFTFKMFENIPTATNIKNFVFNSAHHEEWNVTGSKFFNAAGVVNTGVPIFCKMIDSTTGAPIESELSSHTVISCLDVAGLALAGVAGTPDSSGKMVLPSGFAYPYTIAEAGWNGDGQGRPYRLMSRKTGEEIRPGEKSLLIYQYNAGNPGHCNVPSDKGTVVQMNMRYGWGNDTHQEAVSAYCLDMSSLTVSGTIGFYNGGEISVKQSDSSGHTWTYSVRQVGQVDPNVDPTAIAASCYFAGSGNLTTSPTSQLTTSGGAGGANIAVDGQITALGSGSTGAVIDKCSNAASLYPNATQYYLIQMGMLSQGATRANIRAYLMAATGNNAQLRSRAWGTAGVTNWEDTLTYITPGLIETSLGATRVVAPATPPTFTQWVKLANLGWNAKFDPYCDDLNGNGKCDCFLAGTTTPQTASCGLADDVAEPTISQAPYWPGSPNAAAYIAFFNKFGGQSGANLHWANSPTNTIPLDGNYINTNQLYLPFDQVFQCANLATSETTYRHPDNGARWDGFWKNAQGCPDNTGAIVGITNWGQNNEAGGGPVRLINPKPMNNAYDVVRPNTMIKLINFATKTVGQGITILSTDKVFSFDEAFALMALRFQMPAGVTVYAPGTSAADPTKVVNGGFPFFEPIRSQNHNDADMASAVLRGLVHPEEL